jgi:hypothetical protein
MDAVCRLGEAAETRDLLGRQLIQMENLQVRITKIPNVHRNRIGSGLNRDIQRLLTTPLSLVLRKEYFDSLGETVSTFKRGGRGESVLFYSLATV